MSLDVYHFHCAYAATLLGYFLFLYNASAATATVVPITFLRSLCGRRCDYTEVSKRDGPRTRGRHVPGKPMIAMQTDDRDGR